MTGFQDEYVMESGLGPLIWFCAIGFTAAIVQGSQFLFHTSQSICI